MGKLQEYKKKKFNISPKSKEFITQKDVKEIYTEILRRLEWEYGEEWLDVRKDKEMNELITKRMKEVASLYFKRKARYKFIDKLTDLLMNYKFSEKNKDTGSVEV